MPNDVAPKLPELWGGSADLAGSNNTTIKDVKSFRLAVPRSEFGPWQTVWKQHRRYASDGTWDRVLADRLAEADARGELDWTVSVDATINRAHQHATNTTRPDQDTGGWPNYKNRPCHRGVNLQVTALPNRAVG